LRPKRLDGINLTNCVRDGADGSGRLTPDNGDWKLTQYSTSTCRKRLRR
jgi:hypothetical protein